MESRETGSWPERSRHKAESSTVPIQIQIGRIKDFVETRQFGAARLIVVVSIKCALCMLRERGRLWSLIPRGVEEEEKTLVKKTGRV